MSDWIANIVVLCEDQEQQILVRRYLSRLGRSDASFRPVAGRHGSGSQYVRTQFPKEVAICRRTLGNRTRCLLIVMTDADNLTAPSREKTLHDELAGTGKAPVNQTEPVVILIPKWQVETWIKCLLGQVMDEDDKKSDQPPVTAGQIRQAASTLYDWTRPNAILASTCVPSLTAAIPRWQRIG